MMARITSVGPEAFSRSDRISNGLSTAMRDHMAGNPSRVDMLLGLASQTQSSVYDVSELNEEDIWGAGEARISPEEISPASDVRNVSGIANGGMEDAGGGDHFRFINNGRRWLGREMDSGLSVAYADGGRTRGFPSPLNRATMNGNASYVSVRDAASGRASSRLIPNRDVKVTSHFSHMSSVVETAKVLHQSAPVNVPDWSKILGTERRPMREFVDDDVVAENDEDEERLPPHELLARESSRSELGTFSMCEGAGRTLKGRDLSRVRNAILRQTGFFDDQ